MTHNPAVVGFLIFGHHLNKEICHRLWRHPCGHKGPVSLIKETPRFTRKKQKDRSKISSPLF